MDAVADLLVPAQDTAKEIHYSYDDAPTLARFAADDRDLRIVKGPFGSGKTSASVMEFIRRAQMQPMEADGRRYSRFLAVRNTYRQLKDTTLRTTLYWFPETYFGHYHKSDMTYTIDRLPGLHIEIIFRALDRPEHVQNLLSLEITGAFINEIREMRWAIIEALFGRVGRYPQGCTWSGLWGDTNPPGRSHWIYHKFEAEKPPKSMSLYSQPSGMSKEAENLRYLPGRRKYYERMVDLMDEETARVYVHGEYGVIKAGKPVFPQFSERLHVRHGLQWDPRLPLWRGWDFGLTPACVIAQVLPTGHLQVLCEMTTQRAGIDTFADHVLAECAMRYPKAKFRDIADPAGKSGLPIAGKGGENVQTCFSILNGKGIFPDAADNSLNMRLEAVRYGLKTIGDGGIPLLQVDGQQGIMLRDGLAGAYHYREVINTQTVGSKFTDEPEKNEYSHPMDALQYICEVVFGFLVRRENEDRHPQAFQDGTESVDEDVTTLYEDDDDYDDVQEFQFD